MSNENDTINYKINEVLKDVHQDVADITEIDFKRHTKPEIALRKKTTIAPNGRPQKNSYYYNDELVATLTFEFTDENSLMKTRKEIINYIKNDGSNGPDIVIKDKVYDHTDPDEGAECIDERIKSRKKIVGAMKAFLSGVIMQALQAPLPQVISVITPFWDDCYKERELFIEFGTSDWSTYLMGIDVQNTTYTYLSIPINAQGVTVRDYMVSRLNY